MIARVRAAVATRHKCVCYASPLYWCGFGVDEQAMLRRYDCVCANDKTLTRLSVRSGYLYWQRIRIDEACCTIQLTDAVCRCVRSFQINKFKTKPHGREAIGSIPKIAAALFMLSTQKKKKDCRVPNDRHRCVFAGILFVSCFGGAQYSEFGWLNTNELEFSHAWLQLRRAYVFASNLKSICVINFCQRFKC